MLKGKKILLGVTGSIAAYKSAYLIRHLVKAGAEVKVIMTPAAASFISPLTLSTLSRNPVFIDFVKNEQGEWNNHVELGLWADLMVIAPATANTLAKMAQGLCDNLLMATYLSSRCSVWAAPAMDLDMYVHPSVKRNITQVQKDGVTIIEARTGELASGLSGQGRMAEPEEIFEAVETHFSQYGRLHGKKALVTAGPTQEHIDPVRFISNHSTGKMGYALVEQLLAEGCEVELITGPVPINKPKGAEVIEVKSAQEMLTATMERHADKDLLIFCAAVADYRPSHVETEKIKKKGEHLTLEMVKNPDIAFETSKHRKPHQFRVGFALETENEEGHAREKLAKKGFDMIVLNSLRSEGAGFGHDTNKITIFDRNNKSTTFELKNKSEVAKDIINEIISHIS